MTTPSIDPVLASLERLHQRLDAIEARLAPLETLTREAPVALAMFNDTADSLARRAGEADLDARLQAVAHLVEQLTRPESLATLQALAARTAELDGLLKLADQAPGALAMLADTLDGVAARVDATGVSALDRLGVLLGAAERLSSPAALDVLTVVTSRLTEVKALLESGVLDPEAVRVVSLAGTALVASRACECGPIGPVGALLALREPEVQRALGFAVAFARQFGAALSGPTLPATR